jgi:hypothetical protein
LPIDQTLHDRYMNFCLSLSSLYSTFFNSSWVQCSGQLKKPNLFFLLQVICLTIWLFIWLSRWIS